MNYFNEIIVLALLSFLNKTTARKESLRKTIYSHSDTIVAPILAYSDDRSCNQRCGYEYPGAADTPHCCGRGDTAGTYFCCKYETCCNLSYCCAPGYHCSESGDMCTSSATNFTVKKCLFVVLFLTSLAFLPKFS